MKLTVFGATGRIGEQVVRQALDAGHKVTAVVRDPARFDVRHPALEVATVAGLTDPEVLRPALEGSDAAISGVGPRGRKDGPVASSATRGILRAMEASGVRRRQCAARLRDLPRRRGPCHARCAGRPRDGQASGRDRVLTFTTGWNMYSAHEGVPDPAGERRSCVAPAHGRCATAAHRSFCHRGSWRGRLDACWRPASMEDAQVRCTGSKSVESRVL